MGAMTWRHGEMALGRRASPSATLRRPANTQLLEVRAGGAVGFILPDYSRQPSAWWIPTRSPPLRQPQTGRRTSAGGAGNGFPLRGRLRGEAAEVLNCRAGATPNRRTAWFEAIPAASIDPRRVRLAATRTKARRLGRPAQGRGVSARLPPGRRRWNASLKVRRRRNTAQIRDLARVRNARAEGVDPLQRQRCGARTSDSLFAGRPEIPRSPPGWAACCSMPSSPRRPRTTSCARQIRSAAGDRGVRLGRDDRAALDRGGGVASSALRCRRPRSASARASQPAGRLATLRPPLPPTWASRTAGRIW